MAKKISKSPKPKKYLTAGFNMAGPSQNQALPYYGTGANPFSAGSAQAANAKKNVATYSEQINQEAARQRALALAKDFQQRQTIAENKKAQNDAIANTATKAGAEVATKGLQAFKAARAAKAAATAAEAGSDVATTAAAAGKTAALGSLATAGIGAGLTVGGMIVEKSTNDNKDNTFTDREKKGNYWAEAMKGAGTGVGVGSLIPIPGASLVGGVVGAGVGLLKARKENQESKKYAEELQTQEQEEAIQRQQAQDALARSYQNAFLTSSTTGANTGFGYGSDTNMNMNATSNYYAKTGGVKTVPGGKIVPIGAGAVEFVGRKHKDGGIDIGKHIEVEGGETQGKVMMSGGKPNDYFFSAYLKLGGKSFAQRHKDIIKSGADQNKIQQLAKMQEAVANKRGEKDRSPDQIAATGGIKSTPSTDPGKAMGQVNRAEPSAKDVSWLPSNAKRGKNNEVVFNPTQLPNRAGTEFRQEEFRQAAKYGGIHKYQTAGFKKEEELDPKEYTVMSTPGVHGSMSRIAINKNTGEIIHLDDDTQRLFNKIKNEQDQKVAEIGFGAATGVAGGLRSAAQMAATKGAQYIYDSSANLPATRPTAAQTSPTERFIPSYYQQSKVLGPVIANSETDNTEAASRGYSSPRVVGYKANVGVKPTNTDNPTKGKVQTKTTDKSAPTNTSTQSSANAQANKNATDAIVKDNDQVNATITKDQNPVAPVGPTNNTDAVTNANTIGTGSSADATSSSGAAVTSTNNLTGKERLLKRDDTRLGTSKSMEKVPAGQGDQGTYFGKVSKAQYNAFTENNPWFDFSKFDPKKRDYKSSKGIMGSSDVARFQEEYNKHVGKGNKLTVDGKLGEQTATAMLVLEDEDNPAAPAANPAPAPQAPAAPTPPVQPAPNPKEPKMVDYKPGRRVEPWMVGAAAQVYPALWLKNHPFQGNYNLGSIGGAPGVKAPILGRVNFNRTRQEIQQNATATTNLIRNTNTGAAAGVIGALAANRMANDQLLNTAEKEAAANTQLNAEEGKLGLGAQEANQRAALDVAGKNAELYAKSQELKNDIAQYNYGNKFGAINKAADSAAGAIKDYLEYKAVEREAVAKDPTHSYDRQKTYEDMLRQSRRKKSPLYGMSDAEIRQQASLYNKQLYGDEGVVVKQQTGGLSRKYTSRLGELSKIKIKSI